MIERPGRLSSMAFFDPSRSGRSIGSTTASATVEMLIPIWERVLALPSIRIEDNFFAAGGNVQLADLLFAEIARESGRDLPSAIIFHAPTIAALAYALEQPTLPRFSPFILLKNGRRQPPILMAHGLGGRARFTELAKHIHTDHPIYGIQAKGIDGREEPFDRIEDMAHYYLEALKELQPQGPYILIGYSFGGLVALEMAQRLSKDEKEIGLLVLIDAYPYPRYMSARQRLQLGLQRSRSRISKLRQQTFDESVAYFLDGLKRRLRIAEVPQNAPLEGSRLSLAQTTLQVKAKAYLALASYRPQPYGGKIKFVKSEGDTFLPSNPVPVWADLAPDFEAETVPGNHLDMVTTQFEGLAAVLTRYLEEAFSGE
jgi:acetoacetyl-CoA synthetase